MIRVERELLEDALKASERATAALKAALADGASSSAPAVEWPPVNPDFSSEEWISVGEATERVHIKPNAIYARLRNGWPVGLKPKGEGQWRLRSDRLHIPYARRKEAD